MALVTDPASIICCASGRANYFLSFKVATGNHSVFGVATSKMPCLQELSAIGSHSSHVTAGILFIWEKYKSVLPDPEYFLYMFMCVCKIVATVATVATLCCFLDRWSVIVFAGICGRG